MLLAAGVFASAASVSGADHADSPLNAANPAADINDVYAFRSPEDGDNLVVALSINPLIAPSDNATRGVFDPAVKYQLHVDLDGDLRDDATVNIRTTTGPPTLTFEGLGAPFSARLTPPGATAPIVTESGPVKVFAGLRDDPFFFDLVGFQQFVSNPQVPAAGLRTAANGAPSDTLAGTNVLAIVLELPVAALTGASTSDTGVIRTWVSTTRNGQRIDRMAIPTINTALIPSADKDAFNAADPVDDAADYRSTAVSQIEGLRAAVDSVFGRQDGGPLGNLTAAQVGGALIPDVVTIDFSSPVQFPNGRRLSDDVIDVALGLVLNRGGAAGVSDAVDANDKAFSDAFPYLAAPHVGGRRATFDFAAGYGQRWPLERDERAMDAVRLASARCPASGRRRRHGGTSH